jgi:hypothetical protein
MFEAVSSSGIHFVTRVGRRTCTHPDRLHGDLVRFVFLWAENGLRREKYETTVSLPFCRCNGSRLILGW